jgi:hypothetical protein
VHGGEAGCTCCFDSESPKEMYQHQQSVDWVKSQHTHILLKCTKYKFDVAFSQTQHERQTSYYYYFIMNSKRERVRERGF